jgi:hypothetical protein
VSLLVLFKLVLERLGTLLQVLRQVELVLLHLLLDRLGDSLPSRALLLELILDLLLLKRQLLPQAAALRVDNLLHLASLLLNLSLQGLFVFQSVPRVVKLF